MDWERVIGRILVVMLTIASVLLLVIFALVIYGIIHYGG